MGGCFDSDPLHGNAERLSQPFLHRINVRGNPGVFGDHHHVDIGYPVSAFPGFFGSKRYDLLRIDTLDPGIGIGKPVSDIRQSERPEHRVGHGMGNAVGVRMSLEALRSRNFNAAPAQASARVQTDECRIQYLRAMPLRAASYDKPCPIVE